MVLDAISCKEGRNADWEGFILTCILGREPRGCYCNVPRNDLQLATSSFPKFSLFLMEAARDAGK